MNCERINHSGGGGREGPGSKVIHKPTLRSSKMFNDSCKREVAQFQIGNYSTGVNFIQTNMSKKKSVVRCCLIFMLILVGFARTGITETEGESFVWMLFDDGSLSWRESIR